jgi:hypothetical protein
MSIIKDMAAKYSVTAYEVNTDSDLQDHAADELNTILKDFTSKRFSTDKEMISWLEKEFADLIDGVTDGLEG